MEGQGVMRKSISLFMVIGLLALFAGPDASAQRADEKVIRVTIANGQFNPAQVTIKKGQTVTWTNTDARDHTVDADNKAFASGVLKKGDKYSQQFNKAGKFGYGCKLHPRMKGTVTVE
jgi:plastocyanin